jgi:ankyrin repeat protein
MEAMDGISPLHFACQKGHLDTARELINSGANPKVRSRGGTEGSGGGTGIGGNVELTATTRRERALNLQTFINILNTLFHTPLTLNPHAKTLNLRP